MDTTESLSHNHKSQFCIQDWNFTVIHLLPRSVAVVNTIHRHWTLLSTSSYCGGLEYKSRPQNRLSSLELRGFPQYFETNTGTGPQIRGGLRFQFVTY